MLFQWLAKAILGPLIFFSANLSTGGAAHFWTSTGTSLNHTGIWGYGMYPPNELCVGDFDGNGLDDVLRAYYYKPYIFSTYTAINVFPSTGVSFENEQWYSSSGKLKKNEGILPGDFDGDGFDDVCWCFLGSLEVSRSTGSSFNAPSVWYSGAPLPGYFSEYRVGDFTGDGRSDILRILPSGSVRGWRSHLNQFQYVGEIGTGSGGPSQALVGNFGGSAADDLIQVAPDGRGYVWISNGATLIYSGQWGAGMGGAAQVKIGDFTGDGLDDVMQVAPSGVGYVWRSTGASFSYLGSWGTGFGSAGEVLVGDFDAALGTDAIQCVK